MKHQTRNSRQRTAPAVEFDRPQTPPAEPATRVRTQHRRRPHRDLRRPRRAAQGVLRPRAGADQDLRERRPRRVPAARRLHARRADAVRGRPRRRRHPPAHGLPGGHARPLRGGRRERDRPQGGRLHVRQPAGPGHDLRGLRPRAQRRLCTPTRGRTSRGSRCPPRRGSRSRARRRAGRSARRRAPGPGCPCAGSCRAHGRGR